MRPALVGLFLILGGVNSYAESSWSWADGHPDYYYHTDWETIQFTDAFSDKDFLVLVRDVKGEGWLDPTTRIGFECRNGKPVFGFYRQIASTWLGASMTPIVTLMVRVDDNDAIQIPLRLARHESNLGFSNSSELSSLLFAQMLAGNKIIWRYDGSGERWEGSATLSGMTAASKEFRANCN